MEALTAGWIAGYVMGMASTVALAYLAFRSRDAPFMQRMVDPEVRGSILAVPIFLGAAMLWTMAGLMLGAAYEAGHLAERRDFLGSESAPFLAIIAAFAFLPLPPLILFFRRHWWLWSGMSALFLALFGWLMPALAVRALS